MLDRQDQCLLIISSRNDRVDAHLARRQDPATPCECTPSEDRRREHEEPLSGERIPDLLSGELRSPPRCSRRPLPSGEAMRVLGPLSTAIAGSLPRNLERVCDAVCTLRSEAVPPPLVRGVRMLGAPVQLRGSSGEVLRGAMLKRVGVRRWGRYTSSLRAGPRASA